MTSVAILFTLLLQFGCSFQQDNAQSFDPNIDDIYKCVSYTAAHIDISHSINDDFSEFKNCQTSRIHTLNRKDRYFKLDIDVQNSWIVDMSAIIFNGTIRPICGLNSYQFLVRPTESCELNGINAILTETDQFETVSLFYDMGNLTIITTHNKQGSPLHLNINIWQLSVDISDSYGLCKGSTCSSVPTRDIVKNDQRSSYSPDVINAICDIYIGNYLKSTGREPSDRSVHYNRTIENARKACLMDVEAEGSAHTAAGSVEVIFVEERVNSGSMTTMEDIQLNFEMNLDDALVKLTNNLDISRREVDEMLASTTTMTTTIVTDMTSVNINWTDSTSEFISTSDQTSITTSNTTSKLTTEKPNNLPLGIIIGCSIGGAAFVAILIAAIWLVINKINSQNPDLTYQCRAFGDPHVESWALKDMSPNQRPLQHCYKVGPYEIVKNKFVDFRVTIQNSWIKDFQMFFRDGVSQLPRCFIFSDTFDIYPEDSAKCQTHGITWSIQRSSGGYSFGVLYKKANFLAEITHDYASRQYAGHYNIFVWQPKSLVDISQGICTRNDPQCSIRSHIDESMFEDGYPLPQQRAITTDQAIAICATNLNAYFFKTRRAPYERSSSMNATIALAQYGCETDLVLTGFHQAATSSLALLVVEELTDGKTSIDTIQQAITSGAQDAFEIFYEAVKEVEVEVLEIMGLPTPTTVKPTTTSTTSPILTTTTTETTTSQGVTTTSPPRAGFKCSVYQNWFIQTWHPTNEAMPPSRTCSNNAASYELMRNKYVRYTLSRVGSAVSELSIVLFDGMSAAAICTVTVIDTVPQWMDCEKHGITPTVGTTATHTELTIYYARANFTTVVKQDIGINIGLFNIDIYQNPELALQSSGACNLISSCTGGGTGQTKRIR